MLQSKRLPEPLSIDFRASLLTLLQECELYAGSLKTFDFNPNPDDKASVTEVSITQGAPIPWVTYQKFILPTTVPSCITGRLHFFRVKARCIVLTPVIIADGSMLRYY